MTRSILRPTILILAVALLLLPAGPAEAQIPDEFTNLQLLDKDIGKQQLVGIMRDWAGGLGVRCNHCHVGPDNLQGMDFATDEKENKRAARVMLEMSRAINRQYVGSWEEEEEEGKHQTVACFTCHRGQPEPPKKLAWVLGETAMSEGPEAALTQYKELKAEHYGTGLYDFREQVFGELAQAAFEMGQLEAATTILRGSLEIFPESADLHMYLGMALMQAGDAEGAGAKFDDALAIDPDHGGAKRGKMMLERSQGGGG